MAGGQLQGDDLMAVVEDEVQLEAKEPAHLATLSQTGKDLVPVNTMIIARAVESM
jgi:hypothetical protein